MADIGEFEGSVFKRRSGVFLSAAAKMARMRRSSLYWLLGTLAVWGTLFVYDLREGVELLIVSMIIGAIAWLALLVLHIIRARFGY